VGRKLFVFGGYGGDGYARRDFNDLYALDLDVWEWEMIDVPGEVRHTVHFHGL
jgi:dynein heavy chain